MVVQPISVSVVIPTYNRADRLRNCLESLCQQSLPMEQFEVVVVDDGSPESMSSVVDGFRSRLNVTLLRQSNAGPAQARNNGVQRAQADLIAFTDDDCQPRTDWLEKLVRAECENPGALVGGSTVNGLSGEILATTSQFIVDLVYLHFNKDPLNAYFLTSNNMLCGKNQFIALNGFDNQFSLAGGEDRDFCDRWRASGAQIIWQKDAAIDHFHSQTFRKFINLHFRYGIGAYLYQSNRRERGSGGMGKDLAFHQSLIRYIRRELFTRFSAVKAMQILFFMIVWQISNALGFFYAFCMKKLAR
jgi:glycosyltransferase involved in cell wall biosynthesis